MEKPVQPNEWQCEMCSYSNLDFRKVCHQCGWKNNNIVVRMREGDWLCDKCENVNFARRTECFICTKG
jgi:ribosomal protein L37AE/L43A